MNDQDTADDIAMNNNKIVTDEKSTQITNDVSVDIESVKEDVSRLSSIDKQDSGETSEEALVVRNQLTEVKVDLEHKIKDNKEPI